MDVIRTTALLMLACATFALVAACQIRSNPMQATPVERHGQLRVEEVHLAGEHGQPVQLRGMSSHGLQWENGSYTNYSTMRWLRDEWGASVIRAAMYVEEGGIAAPSSNLQRREDLKQRLYDVVDNAVSLGLYVIVDWHVMASAYPDKHREEAVRFFKDVAARYGHLPNIIYETANEPHDPDGDGPLTMTWTDDIKPYHDAVIAQIRAIDSDGIIIAGTNRWSQMVNEPHETNQPLQFDNVLYALHFYTCSHSSPWHFTQARQALANGVPLFVSEWGTTAHDGKQRVCETETRQWLALLNEHHISWVNWSLSAGPDPSAVFKEGVEHTNNTWSDNDLKQSGLLVKELMLAP